MTQHRNGNQIWTKSLLFILNQIKYLTEFKNLVLKRKGVRNYNKFSNSIKNICTREKSWTDFNGEHTVQ